MISLNFEILRYFTKVEKACADDVTDALRFQLDKSGMVKVYYRAH